MTDQIIPFKRYRGKRVSDPEVDSHYLIMLANDFNSDANVLPWEAFPVKVPFELRMAARAELERRGYSKKGSRWVKD